MINWDQVKQLEEDIGPDDFGDVVEMFIAEVDEAIDALRNGPKLDSDPLASALHFLKGSAANLGFTDFADHCSKGEKMAETGAASNVDLSQVVDLYDQSKTQFLSQVSTHTHYTP